MNGALFELLWDLDNLPVLIFAAVVLVGRILYKLLKK